MEDEFHFEETNYAGRTVVASVKLSQSTTLISFCGPTTTTLQLLSLSVTFFPSRLNNHGYTR